MRHLILLTVMAIAVVAGFLRLALWQLDRAEEKREQISLFENAPERALEVAFYGHPEFRYTRVSGMGIYDDSRQLLLDNMVEGGVPGYRVLTPLLTWWRGDPRWILVDRGWVPRDWQERAIDLGISGAPRAINGRLDELPRPAVEIDYPEPDLDQPYPHIVSFPTMFDLVDELDGMALPWGLVRLDEGEADCFSCGMVPVVFTPERHIAYALQWSALAVTVLIIWAVLTFRWWRRRGLTT
jgi:surfeit locus 1 family protein